jgi:hypothetical protein
MSSTITTSRRDATRSAAAATVGGAVALNALGIFGDGSDGAEHSTGEFWMITALILAAAALVFGLVVPRFAGTPRAGSAGLVLAVLGVLLVVPAFWSGLPVVLGAGGLMLGLDARREVSSGGRGSTAIVIGALAVVAYAAIYVLDWMSTNGLS